MKKQGYWQLTWAGSWFVKQVCRHPGQQEPPGQSLFPSPSLAGHVNLPGTNPRRNCSTADAEQGLITQKVFFQNKARRKLQPQGPLSAMPPQLWKNLVAPQLSRSCPCDKGTKHQLLTVLCAPLVWPALKHHFVVSRTTAQAFYTPCCKHQPFRDWEKKTLCYLTQKGSHSLNWRAVLDHED